MSAKDPSLFSLVYEAFGGWSPGGLAVRDHAPLSSDGSEGSSSDRWVLLLEIEKVRRIQGWERIVASLNAGKLPGVSEVRVVERIELSSNASSSEDGSSAEAERERTR